jgi:hypothetical protein
MNAANSTVIVSGTQVLITLELTFNSTFFGPKNIYMIAAEGVISSGWTTVGTWTATGGSPSVISSSPNAGAGTLQTFVFTVSDSSSQVNVTGLSMLFTTGAPTNIANACYLVYDRRTSLIGLWDNTGNTTLATKGLGSSTTMQNSQCAVGFTSGAISGTAFQFSIQIQFTKPAFAGLKSIYLQTNEPNINSGFVYQGTFTVQ